MTKDCKSIISPKGESVVQKVINQITERIVNKELKPGDKLPPEPELAANLGVARSSVREAIKILSYLGVLESKRSEGTSICNGFSTSMIDPMIYGILLNQDDSMENLMELREMTEEGIIRLAVKKFKAEDGREIEELLEQMAQIIEPGISRKAVDDFFEVDNRFHDRISELGKNPMADKISKVVRTLTYSMRYDTVYHMIMVGRGAELLAAHKKLYEVLKSGNTTDLGSVVAGTYFKEVFEK